jgi:hypothetical protein
LTSHFPIFQFTRARAAFEKNARERKRFESSDRHKRREIVTLPTRVWSAFSFLAEEREKRKKKERTREKASFQKVRKGEIFVQIKNNSSYPPEDDISVMAARTPTTKIIAKDNANSFSKIDIAENALVYVLLDKRVKL